METLRARLLNPQQTHAWLTSTYQALKPMLLLGHSFDVVIKPETRSLAANRAMWAALADVAHQVEWYGKRLTSDDWKNIFSASLRKQRTERGLDGEWVVMGQSTRAFSRQEMSDMLELIHAFGAERGVRFTAPEVAAARMGDVVDGESRDVTDQQQLPAPGEEA